ncbi:unnamed protein product [Ixodes hexagonus]
MSLSHFDERSGAVPCQTPWGNWWQTVGEVFVHVQVPKGTRGKDVSVEIRPRQITCTVHGKTVFSGNLHRTVVADESTWTIEEQECIAILLVKSEPANSEKVWGSLLEGQYAPDPYVMHEMMKKLDLEKFQIENPGFDFSGAKLDKAYDRIPESVLEIYEKQQQSEQAGGDNSRQLNATRDREWL